MSITGSETIVKNRNVKSPDGTEIAYSRTGHGPAVVLVDGAMSNRQFGPSGALAAELSTDFTVYTYDRRGRGQSTDKQPYHKDREIEDLDTIIDEAGGSAFVYGISSGGALALRATAKLGAKVRKLALYEVPFTTDRESLEAAANYTKQLRTLLKENKRGDAVSLFLTRAGLPAGAVAGMRQSPMWPGMEGLAPTLAYDDAIMGDAKLPIDVARAVKIPTLVLTGGRSPPLMNQAAEAIIKTLAGAKHQTLEEQTHDVDARVLAPILKQFFR